MRGDLEILAYNVIQWAGGDLPWQKNNLLGNPAKVQQAKDELLSNIDLRLKNSFAEQQCPGKMRFSHGNHAISTHYSIFHLFVFILQNP